MATIHHRRMHELSPATKEHALKLAKEKGYTKAELDRLLTVRNNSGKVIDVVMNYGPF